MHRVTSADALASSVANAALSRSSHKLLPDLPEIDQEPEGSVRTDDDDDVPLLHTSNKQNHTFSISVGDAAQRSDQSTSTAWREAIASFKLAAPVTIQVKTSRSQSLAILSCSLVSFFWLVCPGNLSICSHSGHYVSSWSYWRRRAGCSCCGLDGALCQACTVNNGF